MGMENNIESTSVDQNQTELWRFSSLQIALLVVTAAMLIWAFLGGLEKMVERWGSSEE